MIPHSKPSIGIAEILAAGKVLFSSNIATGPEIQLFEKEFSRFVSTKYAISVVNGTAALHLSLIANKISKNDEVILPANVCPGVLHAVLACNARPVFCDCNRNNMNISIESLKLKISKKTKILIIPHLFGQPADLNDIKKIGIPFIEDCAQSAGAKIGSRQVGSFGNTSIFSFYATKMMTSIDGGMICTNEKKIFDEVMNLRYYGGQKNFKNRFNYKLTNLSAAIGRIQLKKLNSFIEEREKQFKKIQYAVSTNPYIRLLHDENSITSPAYYKAVVSINNTKFKNHFRRVALKTGVTIGRPIFVNLKEFFYNKKFSSEFPNISFHINNSFTIPIYPKLEKKILGKFLEELQSF